jgi:hypothetical protein
VVYCDDHPVALRNAAWCTEALKSIFPCDKEEEEEDEEAEEEGQDDEEEAIWRRPRGRQRPKMVPGAGGSRSRPCLLLG